MKNKLIKLEGNFNFRDFGGYLTKDNRQVKKNLLYRSDLLTYLSEKDQQVLKELNIKSIIDYRSNEEKIDHPSLKIDNIKLFHIDPIASISDFLAEGRKRLKNVDLLSLTEAVVDDLFIEQNQKFVSDLHAKRAYSEMLHLLIDLDNVPMVHHCTSGKDRTGYGSALVLALLGVEKSDIIADYLMSNENLAKRKTNYDSDNEIMNHAKRLLNSVKAEYLNSAFDLIELDYGSVEEYVFKELNFSKEKISKLREMFLEER